MNQENLWGIFNHSEFDSQPKSPARRHPMATAERPHPNRCRHAGSYDHYFFTVVRSDSQIMSLLLGEGTLSCRLLL